MPSQTSPSPLGSGRIDDSGVERAVPALDVAFPVMHTYNLQLTHTIPMQRGEVESGTREESRDLLRPSVRLLCSIGRSLVAEQYRRQMPERMRLRGVKAPKVSEETRKEEREHLHQTLPPTGVAAAKLRWRAKDLGGVYACTCVKAGCSFQPDSYLTLCRHVEEGHYRLRRLRQLPEKSRHCSRSPSVYYPVNPANTKALRSHGKNFYSCEECGLYFSTVKAIQAHYSRSHGKRRFESSETCVWLLCAFCGEWMERESSRLPVCRVQLRGRPVEVVWNEIRQCTQGDAARAASVHVLASLLLFPNAQSPLCFTTAVARGIWWRSGGRCEGLRERLGNAISAIRGVLRFTGKKRYRRVVEEGVDLQDLVAPGRTVRREESGSECGIPVVRKGARVMVKSLPANAPTIEVERGSPVPLSSGTVSRESCQPTRKVIIISNRVVEEGDQACCKDSVAEEGRESQSRNVEAEEEGVPAKRLRSGSVGGVEVAWPAPPPSLLPLGGTTPPSALPAVRMADVPTGGVNAGGVVPSTALPTSWLPKPKPHKEAAPASSSPCSSSPSSFCLSCQSVVQAPRRPCSFVFHHSVVNAAPRREGGAAETESEEGLVKAIIITAAAAAAAAAAATPTTDGNMNEGMGKDLVAKRRVWIARRQNGPSSAHNSAVVGVGAKSRSDLSSARPLAPAIPVSLNVPAAMTVVPMSAASVGLSTGLSGVTVRSSSNSLCSAEKAEALSVVGTLPQLPIEAPHLSRQLAPSTPSETTKSVAQRNANVPCTLMRLELAKAKSTLASPHQVRSSGGYNVLISRKTLDSSIANTLLRMRQLPEVGGRSMPETGGCNIAPHLLKLAPNVEQKVVWNAAPSVAQAPKALTGAGCSAGRAKCVGLGGKRLRRLTPRAPQAAKSLMNGTAGLLKSAEPTSSNAELSNTVANSAYSVSLPSVACTQSAVRLKGIEIEPRNEDPRGSVRSDVSALWERYHPLLSSMPGMTADITGSLRIAQSIATPLTVQAESCNPAAARAEGGCDDVLASSAIMCPMCFFSSCVREVVMRYVLDNH
ncbi:hypothetical protein TcWFU_004042 [Taenia crassiceps]|uniref:C2H2-type domain-containing protein n=1 Tax=Taenia crassiceps TaxID=6207 RepID=A0ABR4Q909_9CEST